MYFNKTWCATEIDTNLIMRKCTNDPEGFPITKEDKNEHVDMERLQVRYQDDKPNDHRETG